MLISFARFLSFAIQFRDLYLLVAKLNFKQMLESIRKYDPDCMYVHCPRAMVTYVLQYISKYFT